MPVLACSSRKQVEHSAESQCATASTLSPASENQDSSWVSAIRSKSSLRSVVVIKVMVFMVTTYQRGVTEKRQGTRSKKQEAGGKR